MGKEFEKKAYGKDENRTYKNDLTPASENSSGSKGKQAKDQGKDANFDLNSSNKTK